MRTVVSAVAPAGTVVLATGPGAVKATSSTTPDGVGPVSYASKTGTLKILGTGGGLHWYHVHKCAGIIRDGAAATLSASYTISPRQAVTSP